MTNFQDKQSFSRPVYLVNDSVVANAVFETSHPFFPLERMMAQLFCIFPHPLQFV